MFLHLSVSHSVHRFEGGCGKGVCIAWVCVWRGRDVHGRGTCVAEGVYGGEGCWDACMAGGVEMGGGIRAGGAATEVGGTHPAGMHSCCLRQHIIQTVYCVNSSGLGFSEKFAA